MATAIPLKIGASVPISQFATTDTLPETNIPKTVGVLVSDPLGDAITTGNGKAYIRVYPVMNGMNLTAVGASVSTVSSSGAITVQVRRVRSGSPADMLSTPITIDASETDSSTAAAAVIDAANDDVATADQIHIDIDAAGTGAKGLFVTLTFNQA